MEPHSKRSHKEQIKRERYSEQNSLLQQQGLSDEPSQPKFGNLIPQTKSNTELGLFAENVLGRYDDTMQTIQRNYGGHQMARLYGVDRSQPITPVTSTAFKNVFEAGMREQMNNVTIERREPVMAAEGTKSSEDIQRTKHKGTGDRLSPPHSNKPVGSRGKVNPYVKPNHPLTKGVTHPGKPHPPIDHTMSSKPPKKHKRNRHENHGSEPPGRPNVATTSSNSSRPQTDFKSSTASLATIGKASSFTSTYPEAISPTHSDKGTSHSETRVFKRCNSADTPLDHSSQILNAASLPIHTGETGHTSFSCYNLAPSEKKNKRVKRIKKEKDLAPDNTYNSKPTSYNSHVTDSHMTHSLSSSSSATQSSDSKHLSKPTKLNFSSGTNIEESTCDTVDLYSMLKEMKSEIEALPSFLTPIHTPGVKESPFFFGAKRESTVDQPIINKPLQSIKEESPLANNSLLSKAHTGAPNLLTSVGVSITTPTPGMVHDDIIGSVSSSDSSDSSDDSSSDSESSSGEDEAENKIDVGGDEDGKNSGGQAIPSQLCIVKEELKTPAAEESTTFMLDQINKHYNDPLSATLTPMKTSPMFPNLPFPLNDESANLSPAKPMRSSGGIAVSSLSIQTSSNDSKIKIENSSGFKSIAPSGPMAHNIVTSEESDSCSSGEESDSESSDSEDETFVNKHQPSPSPAHTLYTDIDPAIRQESKPFSIQYEDISQDNMETEQRVVYESQDQLNSNFGPSSGSAPTDRSSKKRKRVAAPSSVRKSPRLDSESSSVSSEAGRVTKDTPLLVQIPLSKVPNKVQKPQAKVVPYIVNSNKKRTSSSTDSSNNEMSLPTRNHSDTRYTSNLKEHESSYNSDKRHRHVDNGRNHKERREWSGEYNEHGYPRRGGDSERSDHSDRKGDRQDGRYQRSCTPPHSTGNRYGGGRDRRRRDHGNTCSSDYYFERARFLKREADAINGNDTGKAVKYIQSITFFMRNGFAQENESKWDNNGSMTSTGINKAFKIYSDTLKLLKYTMKLGSDCKPLIANCLRCHSVLLWKMYSLKQRTVAQSQKDLLEVFSSTKHSQKSPNPSAASFSPLPSPASVGSTNSSCSGAGGGGGAGTSGSGTGTSSYHNIQEQSIPVSRSICNKVTEYLTLTGYVHQGLDLWRQAETMSEQYRDIFSSADRRVGHVNQFSPVTQIADWIDDSLQSISTR